MEFVQIPAGEFDMGSPANEKDRGSDEGQVHHVKIARAFYMGKYEVTQKQWPASTRSTAAASSASAS